MAPANEPAKEMPNSSDDGKASVKIMPRRHSRMSMAAAASIGCRGKSGRRPVAVCLGDQRLRGNQQEDRQRHGEQQAPAVAVDPR